jgi:5-methyltetrahydropteroyltriglutamate--homocysteine methyltransferase
MQVDEEQTMQRTKPPFRSDHVGSLLRPQALKDARAKRAHGEITAEQLKAVEDREVEKAIRKQEEIGLQSVTDGEYRRSWWNLDFLSGFVGTEWVELKQGIQFKGTTTRPQGIRVSDKLGFSGHPMVQHFKFLKSKTKRTPKMTIPSPSALYTRSGREMLSEQVYPKLDRFFEDLGKAYRQAVHAFAEAGCRYLQLDEVYIALWCDPAHRKMLEARGDDPELLLNADADMFNAAIEGIPFDIAVGMHLCRGNNQSTYLGSGGYEPVADVLFNKMNAHFYFMEYDSERAGGFEPLRLVPKNKTIVLGLVTTKFGRMEPRDSILRQIEAAAKFIDIDQLCLSPQCGFASTEEGNLLSEDEQWEKLRNVVEIAREVWG